MARWRGKFPAALPSDWFKRRATWNQRGGDKFIVEVEYIHRIWRPSKSTISDMVNFSQAKDAAPLCVVGPTWTK